MLLTPPPIVHGLLALINQPDVPLEQVIELLSGDAVLAAHVLRIINSPYYALPVKLDSVTFAIKLMGLQNLLELVLAIKVAESSYLDFAERSAVRSFWQNTLYAASVARDLYRALGHNRHNLFAITLLHHLGTMVLLQRLPQQMATIVRSVRGNGKGLFDAELSVLGYTHAEVGAALMEAWGLPAVFVEVSRYHHDFYRAEHFALEAAIVHLADSVAQQHCPMLHYEGLASEPDLAVFRYVTLPPQRLERLYQAVSARGGDASVLLG